MTLQDIDKVDKSVRHSGKPNQQCELFGSFWQYKHVIRYHEIGGCHLYMLYTQTTKVTNPGMSIWFWNFDRSDRFPSKQVFKLSYFVCDALNYHPAIVSRANYKLQFALHQHITTEMASAVTQGALHFFCNGEPGTYCPTYNFWL